MKNKTVFEQFKAYYREMESYAYAAQKIHWDMETCAPEKAAKKAIENYTFFRTKVFQMSTAPEYAAMLEKLNSPGLYETLDEAWQYTVRRRKQTYDNFIRITPEFYAKTVKDRAEAGRVWQEAKRMNNYSLFAPYLKREIENAKEKAAYTNPGEDAYNVLISEGEPGMTCEIIDKVFNEVREGLKKLLPKILSCEEPDNSLFVKKYDPDHVRAACRFLLEYIGFDFKAGSMAEVEHPLTAGFGRNDVRVSNHYYDDTAIDPMFSIIHEGGHGLFNQGVDEKYEGTDVEHIQSAGLHESQSRFMENILGRNEYFWEPVYSEIQKLCPELMNISLSQFVREANHIAPGPVRTRADEVTYCLHIILRHEMEKMMFREDFNAEDLPEIWNSMMKDYLGICPKTDSEGILQDLHWGSGYLGYFPSYLLGSIYDGMFLEALEKDLGPADDLLKAGEIRKITAWLREKIHRYGGLYTSMEVIERVCHKPLTAGPLLEYFNKKYSRIYGFPNDLS